MGERIDRVWGPCLTALLILTGACSGDAPTAPGVVALSLGEVEQLALEDEAFLTSFMDERFAAEAASAPVGEVRLAVATKRVEGELSYVASDGREGGVRVPASGRVGSRRAAGAGDGHLLRPAARPDDRAGPVVG